VIEGKLGGYVSILGTRGTLDDLDRLAAERGALVCAVELAKRRAVEAAEQRLQGDFLDLMLTAGAAEERALARRAAEMGYDLDRQHVVILLNASADVQPTLVAGELRASLSNLDIQALLCTYEDGLAALCSAEAPPSSKSLEKCTHTTRGRIADLCPGARVAAGIGRPGTGLPGLRHSFAQAQESLDLARTLFDGDRVLSFGDLGLYHLLCRLQDCEELAEFDRGTLAPLVAYDASHDTDLVRTLEAFFAHHGNVSQAAESLYLHRNSLIYRLERISEITRMDLDSADDRFSLQLALKLQPLLTTVCES
jgi:purine catabolism regulator